MNQEYARLYRLRPYNADEFPNGDLDERIQKIIGGLKELGIRDYSQWCLRIPFFTTTLTNPERDYFKGLGVCVEEDDGGFFRI